MQDIDRQFNSISEWREWWRPAAIAQRDIDEFGQRILRNGFTEPLTKYMASPAEIQHQGSNWREGVVYKGINSRSRAVMLVLEKFVSTKNNRHSVRIYAAEAITAFSLRLRGIFPKFIGSEYTEDRSAAEELFPILREDLMNLSFPSDSFDFVSTNEVLEHVPDIDQSLAEIARVLRPGGFHIGTHPFRFTSPDSRVRARLTPTGINYLTEPEYHGNPMSSGGSLVFEVPGWDILERCLVKGFSKAYMQFIASERHGIVSNFSGGVFVLVAQK